jgi:hypothetical protein
MLRNTLKGLEIGLKFRYEVSKGKSHEICIWEIKCGLGTLKTVVRKLARYTLDLVGLQEVRWEKGDTERAEYYTFSM